MLSHVQLFAIPSTVACQAPLVYEISQARILEWVVISSSRDLTYPGIEPKSLVSPALVGGFFTTEPPGNLRERERERVTIYTVTIMSLFMPIAVIPFNYYPLPFSKLLRLSDEFMVTLHMYS